MITVARRRNPKGSGHDYHEESHPRKHLAPREGFALAFEHQQVAGEHADEEKQPHRDREQQHVKNVRRRRDDGGEDSYAENGIPGIVEQELGRGNAQQRQEENDDREVKDEADAKNAVDEKVKVVGNGEQRLEVIVAADADQEFQGEPERKEVGEEPPGDEKTRGNEDKRGGEAPFFLIEAGGDERPHLKKDPR